MKQSKVANPPILLSVKEKISSYLNNKRQLRQVPLEKEEDDETDLSITLMSLLNCFFESWNTLKMWREEKLQKFSAVWLTDVDSNLTIHKF